MRRRLHGRRRLRRHHDDEDDCVGELDAAASTYVGAIFDCGCDDIPDGDCDCEGNQLDALGVCGGDCAADVNGNGLCDDDEPQTCGDPEACNCDPNALPLNRSRQTRATSAKLASSPSTTPVTDRGMTTYQCSSTPSTPPGFRDLCLRQPQRPVGGNHDHQLLSSPLGATTPENVNPLLLTDFPKLAYDSWVTIRLDGPKPMQRQGRMRHRRFSLPGQYG